MIVTLGMRHPGKGPQKAAPTPEEIGVEAAVIAFIIDDVCHNTSATKPKNALAGSSSVHRQPHRHIDTHTTI
jgi:hypothetical protein